MQVVQTMHLSQCPNHGQHAVRLTAHALQSTAQVMMKLCQFRLLQGMHEQVLFAAMHSINNAFKALMPLKSLSCFMQSCCRQTYLYRMTPHFAMLQAPVRCYSSAEQTKVAFF